MSVGFSVRQSSGKHELLDGFSRRVDRRHVGTLRILNGEGPLDRSMNGWSIGVHIRLDKSKTR